MIKEKTALTQLFPLKPKVLFTYSMWQFWEHLLVVKCFSVFYDAVYSSKKLRLFLNFTCISTPSEVKSFKNHTSEMEES